MTAQTMQRIRRRLPGGVDSGDSSAGSTDSGDSSADSTDSGSMDTFTQGTIEDSAAPVEQNAGAEAGRQEGAIESAKEGELTEAKQCSYKVISDYYGEKDGSAYDDLVPEQGKSSCSQYLQETMNYYEDRKIQIGPQTVRFTHMMLWSIFTERVRGRSYTAILTTAVR